MRKFHYPDSLVRKVQQLLPENSSLDGETIGNLFLQTCQSEPHRSFLYMANGNRLTYLEVWKRVYATLEVFQREGIKKGDRVIIYSERPLPSLYLILSCAVSGVVFLPISNLFSPMYLKSVAKRANAVRIYCDSTEVVSLNSVDIKPLCFAEENVFAQSQTSMIRIPTTPNSFDNVKSFQLWQGAVSSDDDFIIQPTSGSTGQPKLAVRSHRSVLRYARYLGPQLVDDDSIRNQHRFLVAATLTHSFGFHMLGTALSLRAELAIPNSVDTATSLHEVRLLNPTVAPLTPRVLRSFCLQDKASPKNVPLFPASTKFLLMAGGRPPAEMVKPLISEGIHLIEFYGSTEGSLMSLTPKGKWREGISGILLPDIDAKLSEAGELCIKSPGLMKGYLSTEDLGSNAFTEDGYFRTSDICEISEDGHVRILGRTKDVFGTPEGSYVYPERIESRIELIPGIQQAMLVGDGKPFLSAILVLDPASTKNINSSGRFIEPDTHADLYAKFSAHLESLNSNFERIEKVVRFLIVAKPFLTSCYTPVAGAKIRRDRMAFAQLYADLIEQLYDSRRRYQQTFVKGVERRLRPRYSKPAA